MRISKGDTFKNKRLYIAAAFDQKGKTQSGLEMTGKNVAFGAANDLAIEDPSKAYTSPMLQYNQYTNKEGKSDVSYTAAYSKDQWAAIEAAANKDGDAWVVNADLIPKKNGFVINTKTLSTPEQGFSREDHLAATEQARALKEAERQSAQEAAAVQEQEGTVVEVEADELSV